MELLIAGVLTGVAALGSNYSSSGPNTTSVLSQSEIPQQARQTARDILDAGDVYRVQGRPFSAVNDSIRNMSNAYIPMSNPLTEPTYDISKVIEQRAVNTALFESQAPRHMFDTKNTLGIPYGNGEKASGYNIGIDFPGISFSGDPGFSLAGGAKVFIDRYDVPEISPYTSFYRVNGGEPTETLRAELPDDADVMISDRNPYGPLGYYMQLLTNRLYEKTAANTEKGIHPGILSNNQRVFKNKLGFNGYQPGPVYL